MISLASLLSGNLPYVWTVALLPAFVPLLAGMLLTVVAGISLTRGSVVRLFSFAPFRVPTVFADGWSVPLLSEMFGGINFGFILKNILSYDRPLPSRTKNKIISASA